MHFFLYSLASSFKLRFLFLCLLISIFVSTLAFRFFISLIFFASCFFFSFVCLDYKFVFFFSAVVSRFRCSVVCSFRCSVVCSFMFSAVCSFMFSKGSCKFSFLFSLALPHLKCSTCLCSSSSTFSGLIVFCVL